VRRFSFNIVSSNDRLEKLTREYQRFCDASDLVSAKDHAENFIVTAWHIAEWLTHELTLADGTRPTHTDVREFLDTLVPDLLVVEALASTAKHAEAARAEKKELKPHYILPLGPSDNGYGVLGLDSETLNRDKGLRSAVVRALVYVQPSTQPSWWVVAEDPKGLLLPVEALLARVLFGWYSYFQMLGKPLPIPFTEMFARVQRHIPLDWISREVEKRVTKAEGA
jgi:hypothetical protein